MMQILTEQKKSTLVSLNAQIRLKKRVGSIEKGEIFFIQEFNDGQLYLRDSDGRTKTVDLDSLKAAIKESPELAAVFTDELID